MGQYGSIGLHIQHHSGGDIPVNLTNRRWVSDPLETALPAADADVVQGLTPVHFFSHGSTMMLGEESESADYWKACGDEALAHGVKGVVMMVRWISIRHRIHILSHRRARIGMPPETPSKSP